MTTKRHRLRVRELGGNDQYKDIIRVHWTDRDRVKNGSIARVRVNNMTHLLVMRGCDERDKDTVGLDHLRRDEMSLINGQEYEFEFSNSWPWEKIIWAAKSSDPGARVATWIALFFGVLSLLLGLIGAVPVIKDAYHATYSEKPGAVKQSVPEKPKETAPHEK